MKELAVKTLQPGMIFPEPVYIDDTNILVPAGVPLREKDIEQLVSLGIETVKTGAPSENTQKAAAPGNEPEPPQPAVQKLPGILSLAEVQEYKGVYRSYLGFIEQLDGIFLRISGGLPTDSRSIDDISAGLLQGVREHRNSYIAYILGGEVSGHAIAKSSVNTAILSALTASELHIPHHKVLQIVTGALLHDVGMLRLPKEILDKRGGLSKQELQQMKSHPLYGYKIVSSELSFPDEVCRIVLQHHERWDGMGYPRQIPGNTIDTGGRIVSVADAFEAMVSQKSYRNSMVGYQAMKNILSDNSRRFDPIILKAFIKIMGIYPIGSIVSLNNGAAARVIEVRGEAPLRPKIRILINESGAILKQDEGDLIDLLTEKSLFIVKAVDPKELAEKNP